MVDKIWFYLVHDHKRQKRKSNVSYVRIIFNLKLYILIHFLSIHKKQLSLK